MRRPKKVERGRIRLEVRKDFTMGDETITILKDELGNQQWRWFLLVLFSGKHFGHHGRSDRPTGGEVWLGDIRITKLPEKTGYDPGQFLAVFQNYNLIPRLSA